MTLSIRLWCVNLAVQARPSLVQRLRVRKADDEPLPPQLLRKYIAYARQYVHPVLTGESLWHPS